MLGAVGILVIFAMVFGGYMAAGGHLEIILEALPFEFMIIGGAGLGAFVIANDLSGIKHTARDIGRVFSGPRWKPEDYQELLVLLFELIRISRSNPVALEEHIEAPESSEVFGRYPRIRADGEAVDLICDTLRSAGMNYDDPMQMEEVLEKRIDGHLVHAKHPSHALQTLADGLPALGIVAAVLGVIKTMGAIDQPPEVLGKLIGGALVGTFLGVFLAYGLVGPFASRLKTITEEDAHFYRLIREVLVADLHQHSATICIEVGRQNTPRQHRPSFTQLETALREIKKGAA